jgi:hypothetical protein
MSVKKKVDAPPANAKDLKVAREFSPCGPCIEKGLVVGETAKFFTLFDQNGPNNFFEFKLSKARVHTEPCISCEDHPNTHYPNGYMD